MSKTKTDDTQDFCWVSGHYSAEDADAIFQSNDDHIFSLHSQCLEVNTGNMPYANGVTLLPESSGTLELLFGFVYPGRHPELADTPFENLLKLAEAAEKYEVYSAMNVCGIRMRNFVNRHPLEVLNYAFRYHYKDLADIAAPATVGLKEADASKVLDSECYLAWSLYCAAWRSVSSQAFTLDTFLSYVEPDARLSVHPEDHGCPYWPAVRADVLVKMGSFEGNFVRQAIDLPFDSTTSAMGECCVEALGLWKQEVERAAEKISPFREFCG
ncbi:hypothetical protein DL96DRAFT_15242 [Flagelloscypha sp. PMI_526]|nr:hypothetical protein DL96DRAFT_15242 [Flagelloscypha sp. PMI_526]